MHIKVNLYLHQHRDLVILKQDKKRFVYNPKNQLLFTRYITRYTGATQKND